MEAISAFPGADDLGSTKNSVQHNARNISPSENVNQKMFSSNYNYFCKHFKLKRPFVSSHPLRFLNPEPTEPVRLVYS